MRNLSTIPIATEEEGINQEFVLILVARLKIKNTWFMIRNQNVTCVFRLLFAIIDIATFWKETFYYWNSWLNKLSFLLVILIVRSLKLLWIRLPRVRTVYSPYIWKLCVRVSRWSRLWFCIALATSVYKSIRLAA